MVERRRQSRPLTETPETELELMWQVKEDVAVLIERVDNHLKDHRKDTAAKALWLTNGLVLVGIVVDVLTRLRGK